MFELNDEQYRAVMHRDGPMLVLAGPGSGKTAVIIARLLHLIQDEHIDPYSILVLTFSKAAALQMENRFRKIESSVTFGTFHSIFYHILKSQGLYRSGEILTNRKKSQILRRISKKTGADIHDDISKIDRMIECISFKKSENEKLLDGLTEEERLNLELIYEPYVRQCREEGLLDFDDMINDCLKMLESNRKILDKWRGRYRFILVDEFQDIDLRQYEVLKLLAGDEQNVFCVGDDDQSIYSFRGAVPGVMKLFRDEFKDLDIITLRLNYRCPQEVTDHAYKLIGNNKHRFDKKQKCLNESVTGNIVYRCFRTAEEEATYCMEIIRGINTASDSSQTQTTGVLYRISKSADLLEDMLNHSLINYTRADKGSNLYTKEWVKDITAYLKLATIDDRDAFLRILNRPYRGLSRECITGKYPDRDAMIDHYINDDESIDELNRLFKDIDFLKGLNSFGALKFILKGIGMYEYIKEHYFCNKSEDLDVMIDELNDRARSYSLIKQWLKVIEESTSNEENNLRTPPGKESVSLMTIHGSKGLEFDNVIVIGLQEGLFPGKHIKSEEELEEERRLFYVAMTRTRKKLWLIGRRKDDYGKRESRFLKEAGFEE